MPLPPGGSCSSAISSKGTWPSRGAEADNQVWSPDNTLIAYQSNLDGDNDIYVYELATGKMRLVTNNTIEDYAPTWFCNSPIIIFTSDVTGDANLFSTPALPLDASAIQVDEDASQLTMRCIPICSRRTYRLRRTPVARGAPPPTPRPADTGRPFAE